MMHLSSASRFARQADYGGGNKPTPGPVPGTPGPSYGTPPPQQPGTPGPPPPQPGTPGPIPGFTPGPGILSGTPGSVPPQPSGCSTSKVVKLVLHLRLPIIF